MGRLYALCAIGPRSRHITDTCESLNSFLTAMLTMAALATGQTVWAQDPATIGSISYNNTLGAFEIANENNLKDLAVYVNGSGSYTTGGDAETTAHTCEGLTFKVTGPIALTHTTAWNNSESTEDTYTPIGNNTNPFKGTFDGQNKTISGIRLHKEYDSNNIPASMLLHGSKIPVYCDYWE